MDIQRVPESNKGYQLLKKAGWLEGTGLGAQEQGRKTPLQPWLNDGKKGIGCPPIKTVPKPPKDEKMKPEKKKKKTKRIDRETLQLRAIRRKLNEETVKDCFDSNPLLRSNALTCSNPLLD